jgi:molybdenum cofactor biosynthesis enzyme MoaA
VQRLKGGVASLPLVARNGKNGVRSIRVSPAWDGLRRGRSFPFLRRFCARKLHGSETPPEGHPFGIIAAVTECFCDACNRVPLTSLGGLRACLADDNEVDLKAPLRTTEDPKERRQAIEERIRLSLYGKKETHAFDIDGGSVTNKQMTAIGG